MSLKTDVLKALNEKSPQSIPSLCKHTKQQNEFDVLRAVAVLEDSGDVVLENFDRIYREDGGAIYLAMYGLKR